MLLGASGAVLVEGARAVGKTATGLYASASHVLLDVDENAKRMLDIDPPAVLAGENPRLLDEWQLAPSIWNHVRRAIDEGGGQPGQFILAGSAVPADDITRHTGAGRFTRLRMRPMSLFESGHSHGGISLGALLHGEPQHGQAERASVEEMAERIAIGGWPAHMGKTATSAMRVNRDYLNDIRRTDIGRLDGKSHDPVRIGRLLRSLARNVANPVSLAKLAADIDGAEQQMKAQTAGDYLNALERLMVVEDQPAWSPHLRSRTGLRSRPVRHFVDPSLAVAALGATPSKLVADLNTLGFLFESMVIRDLRIYAQAADAEVFHYREKDGLEVDAIVEAADGRWAAFEIKLGVGAADEGARNLQRLAKRLAASDHLPPATLAVIVPSGYGAAGGSGKVGLVPINTLGALKWRAWRRGSRLMRMDASDNLPPTFRASLQRLATISDRAAPVVFAGRDAEFDLLDSAVEGVQRGEDGHTVVIQGVPGAGKTTLMREYGARLMAAGGDSKRAVVPVLLRPSDWDEPPMAILQEVDRQFCEFEATGAWGGTKNRIIGGAATAANALFATFAKRNFDEFKAAAKGPNSLPVAFDDYLSFRFDRRDSTIVLLVDEAQNLNDTAHARAHLDVLHSGTQGRPHILLACFGLANTADRLRELGLSRLSSEHCRRIGTLSKDEATRTVTGTLEAVFAEGGPFTVLRHSRWIEGAVAAILAESGDFPQHLTNGCRALAKIVLDEGLGGSPPIALLRTQCRERRREYYDARLRPWSMHTTALAHAFVDNGDGWTPIEDVLTVLMASDNRGKPVQEDAARAVFDEMCASGYIDEEVDDCRPALPSMTSHFEEARRKMNPQGKSMRAIRAALSALAA